MYAGRYGQQAGGTHPTGMHSCFICHSQSPAKSHPSYHSYSVNDQVLGPVYTEHLQQTLAENFNTPGKLLKMGLQPILSDSFVYDQSSIASVIATMIMTLSVNGPLWHIVPRSFHHMSTAIQEQLC